MSWNRFFARNGLTGERIPPRIGFHSYARPKGKCLAQFPIGSMHVRGIARRFISVVLALPPVATKAAEAPREEISLDAGWTFHRGDVNCVAGPDFILLASTNLTTCTALQTNPSPVHPFLFIVPNANNASHCFYRSLLGP